MEKKGVVAKAEMLVRRPVSEVFEAFVNPEITSKFWFTKSSGRLEPGKRVQWDWGMYNVSVPVTVKVIEKNKRILVEWPGYGSPTDVEWVFTPRGDSSVFVSITESGFQGDAKSVTDNAINSTEGFTLVLAGLKAFMEHNIRLNLVADRHPGGVGKS
jgi:uncharacterized protein YndB with AHSA1/START domain